jgi:hypothetical protein
MFSRTWRVETAGHDLRLVHDCDLVLRTQLRLHVDDALLVQTPWRLNLAAIVIRADLPDGTRVEATAAYGLNGYSRVHRILVNGRVASGSAEVEDFYATTFPEDRTLAGHLARGALSATIYGALMFATGQFATESPGPGLAATMVFGVAMAAADRAITRRAAADRRVYARGGA